MLPLDQKKKKSINTLLNQADLYILHISIGRDSSPESNLPRSRNLRIRRIQNRFGSTRRCHVINKRHQSGNLNRRNHHWNHTPQPFHYPLNSTRGNGTRRISHRFLHHPKTGSVKPTRVKMLNVALQFQCWWCDVRPLRWLGGGAPWISRRFGYEWEQG